MSRRAQCRHAVNAVITFVALMATGRVIVGSLGKR
jgi:hypothetical protein